MAIAITGAGLTGTLHLTWVRDSLDHVLAHADVDEPTGTWTGRGCPDHLALGSGVDPAVLRRLCAAGPVADLIWEPPDDLVAEHAHAFSATMRAYQAGNTVRAEYLWENVQSIWSRAWAANYAVLDYLQTAGLEQLRSARPQRWVASSFDHHIGSHGYPTPHIHNIVCSR